MIHDAIYFAMYRKFITRLSSVLTMLERRVYRSDDVMLDFRDNDLQRVFSPLASWLSPVQ